MSLFLNKAAAVFFLLVIMFLPLPFGFGEVQCTAAEFLFAKPVFFLQDVFFDDSFSNAVFTSDTRSLNTLILLLAFLALVAAVFIRGTAQKLLWMGWTATIYYLAFVLLKYGFDKVFMAQFPTPRPNILYSPFGQLSKDILYWSIMGLSPLYCIVLGWIEVITAMLLIFRCTRVLGLLLALGAFANIVLVNVAFDISVKTFSLLLFAMALCMISPYLAAMYRFFILRRTQQLPELYRLPLKPHILAGIRFFVIGLMLMQVLYPYTARVVEPSPLHGAYSVQQVTEDGVQVALADFPVKRIFLHERGYIIFQYHDDSMKDYYFEEDATAPVFLLEDYDGSKRRLSYSLEGNRLTLRLDQGSDVLIIAKKLDINKLPALQDDFHFTIDELKKVP